MGGQQHHQDMGGDDVDDEDQRQGHLEEGEEDMAYGDQE